MGSVQELISNTQDRNSNVTTIKTQCTSPTVCTTHIQYTAITIQSHHTVYHSQTAISAPQTAPSASGSPREVVSPPEQPMRSALGPWAAGPTLEANVCTVRARAQPLTCSQHYSRGILRCAPPSGNKNKIKLHQMKTADISLETHLVINIFLMLQQPHPLVGLCPTCPECKDASVNTYCQGLW